MNTRLLSSASRLSRTSQHLRNTRYTSTMSSPDLYVAIKGSEGTLHSSKAASSGAVAEVERLWKASKATEKAGETVSGNRLGCSLRSCKEVQKMSGKADRVVSQRTFYGVDGKTVVAVSSGKTSTTQKGGEAAENALKEVSRKSVSSLPLPCRIGAPADPLLLP